MSETLNLKLPLVAASQAQKHVTVNEAFSRIDAALRMNVVSRSLTQPPVAFDGEVYLVANDGVDDWAGEDGSLAFAVGAGWDFLSPQTGWRLWVADEAKWITYSGSAWQDGTLATSPSSAAMRAEVLEFDIDVVGASNTVVSADVIPSGAVVFAVTGRVLDGFDGPLNDWSLGVAGSVDRYGSDLGTATAAFVRGLTGQPQTYYSDTPLVLTAAGGDFGTGSIRLAIHMMQFDLPSL